ncbi:MAG: hypothetical protein NZO58_03595 [Gemmataceae bacterium]|nr:hypothetical protein [Gemmataceae bacterium]
MRQLAVLVVFTALALAMPTSRAGEETLVGHWKLVLIEEGQLANLWLIGFENRGGKWSGVAQGLKEVPETKLTDLKVGELVQFDLLIRGGLRFQFEARLPRAGAKKVLGSITREGRTIPAFLEATTARDPFELDREIVTRTPNDPRVFGAVLELIKQAKERKVALKEVRDWVESALRTAETYGPRLHFAVAAQFMAALAAEKDYAALSAEVAERVEALFDPKAPPAQQMQFLLTLQAALANSAPPAKLKDIEARLEKLEDAAFADYSKTALDFAPAKFKGRQGKSDRAVLVELFTGAMCPPCVAADLAFDALEKSFPSTDLVLLQYHIHVPGPDALCNDDVQKRADYYGRTLRGTPMIYFNGKPDKNVQGGGERGDAEEKYREYRDALEPLLEKPAGAQISAKAIRKGDKITIHATVARLDKTGETVRLRLALVEDWVRYKARNGMLYHHRVVRALPGGPAGIALLKKEVEHSVTVDLADLRRTLHRYLDDFSKNEAPFPDGQRPMRFKDLRVAAFVQDDATNDVLQAVETVVVNE